MPLFGKWSEPRSSEATPQVDRARTIGNDDRMSSPDRSFLPDGLYPFAAEEYPLAEMAMAEAPADLEALLRTVSESNRTALVRDLPVELTCAMPDGVNLRFMVWWPSGNERLHILTPKALIQGRA